MHAYAACCFVTGCGGFRRCHIDARGFRVHDREEGRAPCAETPKNNVKQPRELQHGGGLTDDMDSAATCRTVTHCHAKAKVCAVQL